MEWVEHLVAQQRRIDVQDIRRLAWHNLATIIQTTDTFMLLSEPLAAILADVSPDIGDAS